MTAIWMRILQAVDEHLVDINDDLVDYEVGPPAMASGCYLLSLLLPPSSAHRPESHRRTSLRTLSTFSEVRGNTGPQIMKRRPFPYPPR